MSNFNLNIYLNAYSDPISTNSPNMQNFKWDKSLNALPVSNPRSDQFTLAPMESRTLFSGVRTLLQDNTTQYTISLVPFTSNTYLLTNVGGAAPNFRTPRTTGADATTQITVVANGPVFTFSSTSGTPLNLISGGVVVGDYVQIGNLFNMNNQGVFQIIALSATSFSIQNPSGVAEGPITLGSGFSSQISIFSAAGVQINDTLDIFGGFSSVTQGSYQITSVAANSLQFYSTEILPLEGPITTDMITIYSQVKNFVYMEADQECNISINGNSIATIEPFVINNTTSPGVFMLKSTMFSIIITNNSINTANVYFAAVE